MKVRCVYPRVVVVKMAIENQIAIFFFVYAPQCGCDTEVKGTFYDDLSIKMLKTHGKYIVLGILMVTNMKVCLDGLAMVSKC